MVPLISLIQFTVEGKLGKRLRESGRGGEGGGVNESGRKKKKGGSVIQPARGEKWATLRDREWIQRREANSLSGRK